MLRLLQLPFHGLIWCIVDFTPVVTVLKYLQGIEWFFVVLDLPSDRLPVAILETTMAIAAITAIQKKVMMIPMPPPPIVM